MTTSNDQERDILRELAKQYREIASLDVQQEKIQMWKDLNSLRPQRPMVTIDQLPWNELNINDELTLRCQDPFNQMIENKLRMVIYRYNHFAVDMVVTDYLDLPRFVSRNTLGPDIHENILVTDSTNSVVSHQYIDIIKTQEDLDAISFPKVIANMDLDLKNLQRANELIGDIIPIQLTGHTLHCGIWDFITQFRGVEELMLDLVDRPEFIFDTINKFVDMGISLVDQYEELGLHEYNQPLIHCTGAFNEELPTATPPDGQQSAKDVWTFGLAQTLGPISPEMYNEFEIKPIKRLLDRFGLVYYGCCDPIDRKIEYLRNIKNIRKISISPWANKALCAELIHGDYVYSSKPNPAYLAFESFDEQEVRKELLEILSVCRKNNTNCEFILKDVSTVNYKPENLFRWAQIAMEIAQSS